MDIITKTLNKYCVYNATANTSLYQYVTDLAAFIEAWPYHVTMKCVTSYYTSIDKPSHIPANTANHSSTREAEDHRMIYFRGGMDWIHEGAHSLGDYGKSRMMP